MSLKMIRGDLVKMKVDAIVNPTDSDLSGLRGTDLAIHQIGGARLKNELIEFGGRNEGDAVLTYAHKLPSRYIIHTVIPADGTGEMSEAILESCYINCLELALSVDVKSIAFPLLAADLPEFRGGRAIRIAANTICALVDELDIDVYLVFDRGEALGGSEEMRLAVKACVDEDVDGGVPKIRELLSFYDFNNIPLAEIPIGDTMVSGAVENALTRAASMMAPRLCECECRGFPEELIPELDKIKWTNEDSFTYKLFKIIDDHKLRDSDVYNAAGISKMVFSNLRKGVIPKKKTVFQLCLALPIGIEQATDLLASAGYAFALSDKFEKTIKKLIEAKNTKRLTRIDVIDLILYELGLPVFNSVYQK